MTHRLLSSILALVVAAPALGQLTWIDPGVLPRHTIPLGVSGNGQVVFGFSRHWDEFQAPRGFRWTRENGFEYMSELNAIPVSFVTSASYDGTAFAGYAYRRLFPPPVSPGTSHAAFWEPASPQVPLLLGNLGTGESSWRPSREGWLVSGDGRVVVGVSEIVAGTPFDVARYFRWSAEAGIEPIDLPGLPVAINHDGSVIIGSRVNAAGTARNVYRWTESTGVVDILLNATVTGVNADCTILTVWGSGGEYRWSPGKALTSLGALQGYPYSGGYAQVCDASLDGGIIVGTVAHQTPGFGATLWTPRLGQWDLAALLPRMGIPNTHQLIECTGVSDDGRTIVGSGRIDGAQKGFVLTIPQCSSADFDNDGDAGSDADIEAFFACLAGNCCSTCWWLGADVNSDGDTGTDADIEAFFRVLVGAGC